MTSRVPLPLTIVRVLLWGMAVLMLVGTLASIRYIGGAYGAGSATLQALLALACGAYATLLPRTGRVVLGIAVTALVVLVLYQMSRVIAGDPFGVLGLVYGLTVLILLLLPSSRAFIRR